MNTTTSNNTLQDGYDALMLSYAAGTLDEAQDLIVASHLTLSANARQFIDECEALGGALIETQCTPVDMNDNALNDILERINTSSKSRKTKQQNTTPKPANPLSFDIPEPLCASIASSKRKWRTLFPGMKSMEISLRNKESAARIVQVEPGVKTPHHHHSGLEITLVLDGAFHDETGFYSRGDLIVTDEHCDHTPIACKTHGCTCLVVTTAPIKLHGIARLLNPFLKK